jgi:hypothetical protein
MKGVWMGVRLNWLAVERGDKAALLARLGLVEAGVASDELDSAFVCAVFPGGWLLLVSPEMGLDLDHVLPWASAERLALGGEVEEHVMFSRLRAFRGGAPAWAVTHDPDVDVRGVAVTGEPPPAFEHVCAALAAEQAAERVGRSTTCSTCPSVWGGGFAATPTTSLTPSPGPRWSAQEGGESPDRHRRENARRRHGCRRRSDRISCRCCKPPAGRSSRRGRVSRAAAG